ncbi:MAG: ZIP family metal transporter [Bacteroidetes bacterium]|nr:ZIP family metal transporter [Bacteroidota bacterium]
MATLLLISLLCVPVLAAGSLVFFVPLSENRLKLLLAFSAAYLLALSFLHLIPEVYQSLSYRNAGIWVLIGFFMQVLLEFFSSGIEHGHAHIHAEKKSIPLVLLLGLYVHSFIEGLPLSAIFSGNTNTLSFIMGITLHNLPISMAFTGLLLQQQIKQSKVFFYLLLFALMAPLGALLAYSTGAYVPNPEIFTALVVGIFLHIATTIIFESSEKNHRYHISKLISILLGIALAYFFTL